MELVGPRHCGFALEFFFFQSRNRIQQPSLKCRSKWGSLMVGHSRNGYMLGEEFSLLRASLIGVLLGAIVVIMKLTLAPGDPNSDLWLIVPLSLAATLALVVLGLARRFAFSWLLAREERRRLIRIAPPHDSSSPAR